MKQPITKEALEILIEDAISEASNFGIYLDFNTMKFETADRGKQHWLLENLSTKTMKEEIDRVSNVWEQD